MSQEMFKDLVVDTFADLQRWLEEEKARCNDEALGDYPGKDGVERRKGARIQATVYRDVLNKMASLTAEKLSEEALERNSVRTTKLKTNTVAITTSELANEAES